MAKALKHNQFLHMWYKNIGLNNKTIEKYMENIFNGLIDTIREEVRLTGELNIKNIGKFYLIETGGYERELSSSFFNDGAGSIKYFVPVHYLPRFTASQNFKDYVNDAIVSKEGRRKKKKGKLTEMDKELEARDAEKQINDIRRDLERKKNTGENINDILKDSRQQLRR